LFAIVLAALAALAFAAAPMPWHIAVTILAALAAGLVRGVGGAAYGGD
jgi:hypothetical protein